MSQPSAYTFKPHERPFMPGSPASPDQPAGRRLAYLLIGLLLGLTGGLQNGLLMANLPQIQGALGLSVTEGGWILAAYYMTNACMSMLMFKVRRQFGIDGFLRSGIVVLVLARFGEPALATLATPHPTTGWLQGGLTYAGYNIVGAVIVLPLVRHFLSRRDAVVAGVLSGPLAMLPGLLFFLCMLAWYPRIGDEALPSDFILRQLELPVFHLLFQLMIFSALLESGTAVIHACNERIAHTWRGRRGTGMGRGARLSVAAVLLVGSIFIADRVGLVALIAQGYRGLAYLFLVVYIVPLLTVGLWRLRHRPASGASPAPVLSGDRR